MSALRAYIAPLTNLEIGRTTMDSYEYTFALSKTIKKEQTIKVGVAGSGNLEVVLRPHHNPEETHITVNTVISGFKNIWDEVIKRFVEDYPYKGLNLTLNDAGATPPVVSLRLGQAIEVYQTGYHQKQKYSEADARSRIYSLTDPNSFNEFLLQEATLSPTLPKLNMQVESDDGLVIGTAQCAGVLVAIAAQQKDFIGGSVGEVHGAKMNGLVQYAIKHQLEAIILLIDSGGVRLQEANVGEIEISEIIRALLEARSAGIKTIGVICGTNGAYGGMGIISGCLDYLIVNRSARIGVSGAEVIQAVKGAEVFNSKDRALVWRVYGGRTRYLQGAVQAYCTNKISDIRLALEKALKSPKQNSNLEYLISQHTHLAERIIKAKNYQEEGELIAAEDQALDMFNCTDQQFLSLAHKRNT